MPVIDQGQNYIGGYTDRNDLKIVCAQPAIIFGDHTKMIKYVPFDFVAGADGVKVIRPIGIFYPKLFYYFLQVVPLPDKGYARHFQFLEKENIPIPPIAEQHRIVAKIEELFTRLDAGTAALKKVKAELKRYRQAVLKYAFEGKLTAAWREANKDKIEPVALLLDRIKHEREIQVKSTGKKLKPVAPLSELELTELPKLPKGWAWVRLGEITYSIKDGPHYSPPYQEKGVPFITGGNVRPEGVDFNKVKYISSALNEELNKRCKPEVGDILYTKGGTTGIARVNTYNLEFNVWVHVAVLKIVNSLAPFYVQNALNSHHCYEQSQKYTHGVGNQDLGLTRMVNITLPICSTEEQKQIVQEIERRFSVADEVEKVVEQSLKQSERLHQSILKKAFEGKLVPQDPSDEHADKLLERIKAAKAKLEAEVKVKKVAGKKPLQKKASKNQGRLL